MRRKAFTLIELLVVISIIALLLSILMPSLNLAKESAKKVVCKTNVRSISTLAFLYANDNDDSFNRGRREAHMTSTPEKEQIDWFVAYSPYAGEDSDMFMCPSTKVTKNRAGNHKAAWTQTWASGFDEFVGSYAKNGWCANPIKFSNPNGTTGLPPTGGLTYKTATYRKFSEVKSPGGLPLIADCYFWFGIPMEMDLPWPDDGSGAPADSPAGSHMARFALDRHRGGDINIAFADNSVQSVHIKKLWSLSWHKKWLKDEKVNRYINASREGELWPEWMQGL